MFKGEFKIKPYDDINDIISFYLSVDVTSFLFVLLGSECVISIDTILNTIPSWFKLR